MTAPTRMLQTLSKSLTNGASVVLQDLPPSGLAFLLAREPLNRPLLVVTATEQRADQLAGDLGALGLADVRLFLGEPHVLFEELSPDPNWVFGRLSIRHQILTGTRPQVIVTTAAAVLGRWSPNQAFLDATDLWVTGEELGRHRLAAQMVLCGYQPVSVVEDEGTFAVRGGIVDLFPPGMPLPVRVDLFGDEIASIKTFEPSSQRTIQSLASLALHPIRDVVFTDAAVTQARERLENIADEIIIPTRRLHAVVEQIEQRNYFFGVEGLWPTFYDGGAPVLDTLLGDDVVVVLDDVDTVRDALDTHEKHAIRERSRAIEKHRIVVEVGEHMESAAATLTRLKSRATVSTVRVVLDGHDGDNLLPIQLSDWHLLATEMEARRKDSTLGEILDPLEVEIRHRIDKRHRLFLMCGTRGNAERLRDLLRARKLDLPIRTELPDLSATVSRRDPEIAIVIAGLSSGLVDSAGGIAILTDVEIFGATRQSKKRRKRAPKDGLTTLKNLAEGDLVIHVDHGIGRYLGLKRLVLGGVDGDYVHLEYAGGDLLYLPIYRLNLLQRYRGPKESVRLDKLGGNRWIKAKQRVKDAMLAMAHQLLAVQARRQSLPGLRLPEPDDQFRAFEATFPFEETPDQQRAIDEVIADLCRDKAMDRLVCGDVGFGKTEVAIRAAFLTVLGGKQVAMLVPTTVLAEQHGITFRERLAAQPLRVEVLSRFRSQKDLAALVADTRDGKIDIVIGTHRLLSADVAFKDLGLLIVDEEQRFGVRQKERIKQLRAQVHILTLSATPIPRTLHMAVTGLRDLSIIQTPPAERVSIRTEVVRFDEEVIRTAIQREIHRGGQVFVVHNRVRSIDAMARFLERLVPEARIVVAHGQMSGERLERIMIEFIRRDHDVLVCTAIIESGIDIPTANTMLVNRADTFGLAQLYQLRGRIGRSRDRGYAYLLLPRSDRIHKEALERLAVLKRFTDLGSGFQIATHDLDLRGAGDLLGGNQSGHIAAVGFELYSELLNEAVEKAKGLSERLAIEPDIKLPITAVLPEAYVGEPMRRLAFYQRMAQAQSDAEIFDVLEEIEDLYGKTPDEVKNLAEVMVIRRRLMVLGCSSLSCAVNEGEIKIGLTFIPEPPIDQARLAVTLQAEPKRYRLLPSGRLAITVPIDQMPGSIALARLVRDEVGLLPAI